MRRYWLSRSDSIFATQKTPWQFDKWSYSLNRRGKNGHTRQFFIPEFETTQEFRAKNIPVEEQLNSDVLDQLAANVDFSGTDAVDQSLNRDLKKARLDKLIKDTQLIGERLQQRKRQLFNDWSQAFFEVFADSFGKLKNNLISMHLNEEQINNFNQCLDNCLENLQLNLDNIWNEFNEKEKEQNNE